MGAARNNTPGARCRLGRQTAVSNATRNEDSSLPGALVVSTTATPLAVGLDGLGIGEAERLEGLADQPERRRSVILGRLLGNQPGEIGHVLAPHARR